MDDVLCNGRFDECDPIETTEETQEPVNVCLGLGASSLAMAETASVVLWQAEAPCLSPKGMEMSR